MPDPGQIQPEKAVIPEEEVEKFLNQDIIPQLRWYSGEADRAERWLNRWTWLGIIFGFLATVIAAVPGEFREKAWIDREFLRWLVVVVSAAATLASGTIAPRYRRLATMRETGRVKTASVEKRARLKLGCCPMTLEERCAELLRFADELIDIETNYGASDRGSSSGTGEGGHTT